MTSFTRNIAGFVRHRGVEEHSMTVIARPRAVFSPREHLHRDLSVARDLCEGRFAQAGSEVLIGDVPHWSLIDVHRDGEWWFHWSTFTYGLDLAYAYRVTGDEAYLHTWARLVRSWIAQMPVELGSSLAIAHRIENWICAWTGFQTAATAPVLDSDFERDLGISIAEQAGHLQRHLSPAGDARISELFGLFVAALALPPLDPYGGRLRFAWQQLQESLFQCFGPDGVHRGESTQQHMEMLRIFLAARENARQFNLPVPASYDERLGKAVQFVLFCQRPDGSVAALSDSEVTDARESLLLAAALLDRADVLFAATDGRTGAPPADSAGDFEEAGYFIRRSPWSSLSGDPRQQRHLVFDCGSIFHGSTSHHDLLNIEAWAGRPLIVDPGGFASGRQASKSQRWFKSTAAHNTVVIDDLDQAPTGFPRTRGEAARGRLLTRLSAPRLDVLGGEARSSQYAAVHQRHIFCVADEYWIVLDELQSPLPHDYDLRFHLSADAWEKTQVRGREVTAPGLTLLYDAPAAAVLEPGWVSQPHGPAAPAPVISIRARQQARARFVTALMPGDSAYHERSLNVATGRDGELHITVNGVGLDGTSTDTIRWSTAGVPFTLLAFEGTADVVWTRTADDEDALEEFVAAGLHVTYRVPRTKRGTQFVRLRQDGTVQVGANQDQ